MTYELFMKGITRLVDGTDSKVDFRNEDGKFIAKCSDGITIMGNSTSSKITVRWGSGHQAQADTGNSSVLFV